MVVQLLMKVRQLDEVERPTLRGLTSGIVNKVRSDISLKPCVVFGDVLPGWLFVLRELGFEAIFVVLKSEKYFSEVEALVGDKCGIWCGCDWTGLTSSGPKFEGRRCVGFVEGRVTGGLMALVASMALEDVICTKLPWRGFSGWLMGCWTVVHSAVGGIMTTPEMIAPLRKGSDVVVGAALPFIVSRDASPVLSTTEGTRRYRKAPLERTIFPLECRNLGTPGHPKFHGGGLLPAVLDRSVYPHCLC
jgi:hypothetical protein